jgi:hypothetical protein
MVAETDLAGLNAVRAARQERWIVEGAAVAAVPKPPPEDGTVIPAGQWVRLGDGEAILREPYTMGSGTSVLLSSQSDGNFSVEARDIVDWG